MTEHEHERLAEELERESGELQQLSDRLAEEIDEVRSEWHRKQQDDGVPGAVPAQDEESAAANETSAPADDGPAAEEGDLAAEEEKSAANADPPDPDAST